MLAKNTLAACLFGWTFGRWPGNGSALEHRMFNVHAHIRGGLESAPKYAAKTAT